MGCGKMNGRSFTREFKLAVLQELQAGKSVTEVCRERELKAEIVCRWRREYERDPERAFSGKGNPCREEAMTGHLERKIGQLCIENDFLRKANIALQGRLAELKKTRQPQ